MRIKAISIAVVAPLLVAVIVVGVLKIPLAAAQVDATSSETVATSSESETPTVAAATSTTKNPFAETTTPDSVHADASTSGLVEVHLLCSQSYTGPLYDTPSGHLENTSSLDATGASTTSTVANVIGQQSWTVCHDARGHVHEFRLTPVEYTALSVRGMPLKSVMEPADEAQLDTIDVAAALAGLASPSIPSARVSEATTSLESASSTPNPAGLGEPTSAAVTPPDTSSTSTTAS